MCHVNSKNKRERPKIKIQHGKTNVRLGWASILETVFNRDRDEGSVAPDPYLGFVVPDVGVAIVQTGKDPGLCWVKVHRLYTLGASQQFFLANGKCMVRGRFSMQRLVIRVFSLSDSLIVIIHAAFTRHQNARS